MNKRLFDVVVSFIGLVLLSPFLVVGASLVWLQDFHNPLYIAPRARRRDSTFKMVKLRSMVKNADQQGGSSTAGSDKRITWVGRVIRRYKLDELTQLWNVFLGDMSLVGPRPQVMRDVELYTEQEFRLFNVRPGITDFASIVFSDEGEILRGSSNPDLQYNQVIRPWKSRLGLFYVEKNNFFVDIQLIYLTILAVISKPRALEGVQSLLRRLGASGELVLVAARTEPLVPFPPPGSDVVETRY